MITWLKTKEEITAILDRQHGVEKWLLSWYKQGGSQFAHICTKKNGYWELDGWQLLRWNTGRGPLYEFIAR